MTRSDTIKLRVLVGIVALLCLSLYYSNSKPDVTPAPRAAVRPPPPAPVDLRPVSQVDELPSLPLLSRTPPAFSQSRRNLFEYGGEAAYEELSTDEELAQSFPEGAPQTMTGPAPPPGSEITFVGLYREKGKPNSRLAAVSINKNILVVRKGDTLPGGYVVIRIEDNALTLSLPADKLTLRYPLGRNAGPPTVQRPR